MFPNSNQPFRLLSFNSVVDTNAAIADLEGQATPGAEPTGQQQLPLQQAQPSAVPAEEPLYEVKVNGQTIKVPLAELTGGYSRQQDYTRKTTEIAEYRRQIDAEVAQYRQQLTEVQQFFSDPRVRQALANLQAGVQDPNQPLTAQQAQHLYAVQAQQQQQELDLRIAAQMQELEVKTLASNMAREIDTTIAQLREKHPVLADIDGFEVALRNKVAERQPQSLEEAKRYFVEIAQQTAQRLESRFQTQQKQSAAQAAAVVRGGIEPPGGAAIPLPQERKFKLGSNELLQAALADLTATHQ